MSAHTLSQRVLYTVTILWNVTHSWFLIHRLYKKYKFSKRNKSYQIRSLLWLMSICSDELRVNTVQMCFCEGLVSYSSDTFFKVKFWRTRRGWPLEGQTRPHLNVLQHHYTVGCEHISNNASVLGVMFYSTPSWKEKTLEEKKEKKHFCWGERQGK